MHVSNTPACILAQIRTHSTMQMHTHTKEWRFGAQGCRCLTAALAWFCTALTKAAAPLLKRKFMPLYLRIGKPIEKLQVSVQCVLQLSATPVFGQFQGHDGARSTFQYGLAKLICMRSAVAAGHTA